MKRTYWVIADGTGRYLRDHIGSRPMWTMVKLQALRFANAADAEAKRTSLAGSPGFVMSIEIDTEA